MIRSQELTLQVNTSGAWKNVVYFTADRRGDVVDSVRRLAAAVPRAKWCIRRPDGTREWLEPFEASRIGSMRVANRAIDIADHAARSDVELYAAGRMEDGRCIYDLTAPASIGAGETDETKALQVQIAQRGADHTSRCKEKLGGGDFRHELDCALRYLELRGDALPWRLVRSQAFPALVKFEEKP